MRRPSHHSDQELDRLPSPNRYPPAGADGAKSATIPTHQSAQIATSHAQESTNLSPRRQMGSFRRIPCPTPTKIQKIPRPVSPNIRVHTCSFVALSKSQESTD